MPLILWPEEFESPESLPEAGGKCQALAAMADTGAPVPDWFAVLPDAGADDVRDALVRLNTDGGRLAVRSSARGEDGPAHSFAEQLESFLEVAPEDVWTAVEAVRCSAQSERVTAYRREHGLPLPAPEPAVMVQRMVDAKAAGVAFSADPVTGRRGIAVVSAVHGLGARLVNGDADADTWHVNRRGEIVEVRSADAVLSPAQVLAVAELARLAERHFHAPQDIEWAFDAQGLWLLQSRPITSLRGMPDPDGAACLWDNSNIAESYPGITLPLTFSFARRAYEEVYRQFCLVAGVPRDTVAARAGLFRRMIGIVHGRVYYSLLSWYRVLALLPGFRVNRRFMESMMGVKEGLPDEVLNGIDSGSAWRDRFRLAHAGFGLLRRWCTLDHDIARFHALVDATLGAKTPDLSSYRMDELAAHYRDLETRLLARWNAPLVNDLFAMIFHGLLRSAAVRWCGDSDGALASRLLVSRGGIVSAAPAEDIKRMAGLAAADPDLQAALARGSLRECRAAIRRRPDFSAALGAYLDRFGDRCSEELKLESLTLRDDPLPLFRSIAALRPAGANPAERGMPVTVTGGRLRRVVFDWILRHARRRVAARENLRFERTRVFGRVRRIFTELGHRLHADGRLADARDIFYLEVEEALGFVEGTTSCTDLATLAAVRKAAYESYRTGAAPPDRFETRGAVGIAAPYRQAAPPAAANGCWKGTGACAGLVRGRIRVVRDPRRAPVVSGDILVAERTDPGWILLFPLAAGLLVERGSLLSHSAIVARELGLPAIVSLPGITAALRDGDVVEMNGATGEVRRVVAYAG